jgi:SAM-dependent methyltransferase
MNSPWFKDENFWRDLYPYMFDAKRLAKTAEETSGIIQLLNLQHDDKIIDFGCGNGRHLIELAKRGYVYGTGIDSTGYYIDIAKHTASETGVAIKFEVDDMLHRNDPNEYAIALSLFASFGYYDAPEDNLQVLKNMYSSLKSGGKLLIDVRGKENFAYNFDGQSWARSGDNIILTKRTASDDFSKIENTWTIINGVDQRSYTFTHWIYSAKELKDMLASIGFDQMTLYGDFTGVDYSPKSTRLIIVAQKR